VSPKGVVKAGRFGHTKMRPLPGPFRKLAHVKDDLDVLELCLSLELNNGWLRAAVCLPHEPVDLINNPLHNIHLIIA
jgi:hypothetical protein